MRILLVEDEERLARSLARGLRQSAHAVDVATRLAEARDRLALEPYEVILLDVNLPDGDGFTFLRRLRADGVKCPVVLLTARDALDDRVTGLDAGADDYLVKPFALPELLARMRALRRRAPEPRPPVLRVNDLEVDPAAREARRGERPIPLTTTEYALLEHLALRAGRVCSRASIGASVWDESHDPASNVIDVYVARLRRKIDAPGEAPLLHTVRGAGYRLGGDPA